MAEETVYACLLYTSSCMITDNDNVFQRLKRTSNDKTNLPEYKNIVVPKDIRKETRKSLIKSIDI